MDYAFCDIHTKITVQDYTFTSGVKGQALINDINLVESQIIRCTFLVITMNSILHIAMQVMAHWKPCCHIFSTRCCTQVKTKKRARNLPKNEIRAIMHVMYGLPAQSLLRG